MTRNFLYISYISLLLLGCREASEKGPESVPVSPENLVRAPLVRSELSEHQKSRITKVQQIFSEVDRAPLAEWIKDFQSDRNPDREIAIWEAMAKPFEALAAQPSTTLEMKKEAFSLLLQRSGSSSEETLEKVELDVLSMQQAQELVDRYELEPQPILVAPKTR